MTALVTVAGTPLPEPSEYRSGTSTLVDSARNVEGKVVGSVVRPDVAKIELKWRYLTAQQWASVLSLFKNSFYNSVKFFDQTTADYTTRDMYVGDRNAGMWRRNPATGEVMGFVDCSLNLIEV